MAEGTEDATVTADITLAICMTQLSALYGEELNPVSIKAQKRVSVPVDLDLTVSGSPLRSGNIQGTFREHSGNIQGTFKEHSGNTMGTFRERCGNVKEPLHIGYIQGTLWERLGNIRGTHCDPSPVSLVDILNLYPLSISLIYIGAHPSGHPAVRVGRGGV
jgi:hypothetical protein